MPPIAEEEEIEEVPDTDISESEIEAQTPQHVPAATKTVHGTNEAVKDIISSADKLVWGKSAQRSNNRSNSRNVAALRSNRIARFIDHLKVSQENDDEVRCFLILNCLMPIKSSINEAHRILGCLLLIKTTN